VWEIPRVRSEREQSAETARSPQGPAAAAPSAPLGRLDNAADVLALQRRIGNAATGRWLARQATGTGAGWTNICATEVAAPAGPPQAIPADAPLIHSVAGPCLTHWAAGYHWYVTYQLPHPATTSGHIIQELWQQGSDGGNEHFWEYWPVAMGRREPGEGEVDEDKKRPVTPTEVTPSGVPYDDRYTHFVVPGRSHASQGWYRHIGIVRFYPGPLPPQFTGTNRQTYVMPDGWTGTGARHDCYAEWDSRPGRARRLGLVAFAGTREFRAGDPVTGFGFRP
jgi:hypothetical protein